MQWRPLLPKEGGLIQVDISGHPPFPTSSKQFSGIFGNLLFLAVFSGPNFRGCFEALNDIFWENREQHGTMFDVSHTKFLFLGYIFVTRYHAPQTKIVCQSYTLGKLTYQLPPSGPANLLAFHLPGLGFWIFLMLKRPLEPHFNYHPLVNASSHHISYQR
jgi:hypothetical protein